MTPSEKIEQIIVLAPPDTQKELRHWVRVQRHAGVPDEVLVEKFRKAFIKIAKEKGI